MPSTFYLCFEVIPSQEGLVDQRIKGGQAHCWVIDNDPTSAAAKATYHVEKSGWKIKALEIEPVSVSLDHFHGKDLGEKCFIEAQEVGIATFVVAHTPVKELQTKEPVRQTPKKELNLSDLLQAQQAIRSSGRCLFYHQMKECHEVIDAHSIQKNGALSRIARDGYVYSASTKFTDIKKNKGKLALAKTHINSMSTFRGFCRYHDNLVFRPIDTDHFRSSDEQAFLFAYRSILREVFAKECVITNCNEQLKAFKGTEATKQLFEGVRDGNLWGLANLQNELSHFNNSHKERRFDDIRYVMFESKHAPTVVFSGGIFPDWGFNGEPIQNLIDQSNTMIS